MSKPIVIAFANQKGGAGKSTIGTHVASALYYIYGYKVAMADFDYPQLSLIAYRREENAALLKDTKAQDRFLKQGRKPYPIIHSSVIESRPTLDLLVENEEEYDFILVDSPGTLNVSGLAELLESIDYIFLPMEADRGTIVSTMGYMEILKNFHTSKNEESNLKGFYAFWNKYTKSERQGIYESIGNIFATSELPMLNTRLENLLTYRDNRSTLISLPESELNRLALGRLIMEVLTIVLGEGHTTPSGLKIAFTPTTYEKAKVAVTQVAEAKSTSTELS